jgi:hypothetical protein
VKWANVVLVKGTAECVRRNAERLTHYFVIYAAIMGQIIREIVATWPERFEIPVLTAKSVEFGPFWEIWRTE